MAGEFKKQIEEWMKRREEQKRPEIKDTTYSTDPGRLIPKEKEEEDHNFYSRKIKEYALKRINEFVVNKSEKLEKAITPEDIIRHHSFYTTTEVQPHVHDIIYKYPKWKLTKIPVNSFNERATVDYLVEKYKEKDQSSVPALIAIPDVKNKYNLLDGAHRLEAAKERGETHVKVFVPINVTQTNKSEELDKGAKGDWQKEGYSLKYLEPKTEYHKKQPDFTVHTIKAYDNNGNETGTYDFIEHHANKQYQGQIFPNNVYTKKEHQQKGLASAAYKLIEDLTDKKLSKPIGEDLQSDSAKALWSQPNRPFGGKNETE